MENNDAANDRTVDLKKSARRRLVGAIALSLLSIIILPMVMEREQKPASQDIQVEIPNRDSTPSVASEPAITPAAKPQSSAVSPQTPQPPSPVVTQAPQAVSAPAATVAAPGVTESVASPKSAPKHSDNSPNEVVRAQAALSGNPWLVRLGAYQNPGNVRILLSKVKEMGFPAYSEKFDSPAGSRMRVYAGPFDSREAADRAQARIKKIGVEGAVVAKP